VPEGPELATSRDRLKKIIEGKHLLEVSPGLTGRYTKKLPEGQESFVEALKGGPARIEEVATHGKFMWWRLQVPKDTEYWFLHCTYGMSAQWGTSPSKHTAYVVKYGTASITRDSQMIFFNDMRHFGTIKFVRGGAQHRKKLGTLGPCILGGQLTPEIFAEKMLGKPTRTIAEALMDQSAVAGTGNYLRAEILHDCRINPWRNVTEISANEYANLCEATIRIANASYESQGASIKTYRNVDGTKGTTQFNFQVYSRKECPFGHQVQRRQDHNGRMMHWCPGCQT
jgi:DNA-formamidopyrimidine glycosylase